MCIPIELIRDDLTVAVGCIRQVLQFLDTVHARIRTYNAAKSLELARVVKARVATAAVALLCRDHVEPALLILDFHPFPPCYMLTTVLAYFRVYKKAVIRKFRTTAFSLFCFFQLAMHLFDTARNDVGARRSHAFCALVQKRKLLL